MTKEYNEGSLLNDFIKTLSENEKRNEDAHPIAILRKENKFILKQIDYLQTRVDIAKESSRWKDMLVLIKRLNEIKIHYKKVNDIISKYLQTPEHIYITRLMREEQKEIFNEIYEIKCILESEFDPYKELSYKIEALLEKIRFQCSREEKFYYEDINNYINQGKWDEIFIQMKDIGFLTDEDTQYLPRKIFLSDKLDINDITTMLDSLPISIEAKDNYGQILICHGIKCEEGFNSEEEDVIRYFKETGLKRKFIEESLISYNAIYKSGDLSGILKIYLRK